MNEKVEFSLISLQNYIEENDYKGYDPYDGLNSPLFRLPFFSSNKLIRFLSQQLIKRFPINLRPLLLIKKGCNPVTLGLCIQSYARLITVYPQRKEELNRKIELLIQKLELLIPKGYSGACWGYDFDWAARYSNMPAYEPTVVATGIISNSLFIGYEVTKNEKAKQLCVDSCEFILKDLKRTYDNEDEFCFSYSPFDKEVVFNASMKAVRILSQAYSITQNTIFKEEAKRACSFVIKHQSLDGSWIYSKSKTGTWIDNYHTGYILDCLHDYIKFTGDNSFVENLKKGYDFYKSNFFAEGKIPKFYDRNTFPIDCTSAGQSLLTLSKFDDLKLAENVCIWMKENMQSKSGAFYFRKYKNRLVKTHFMRWSNAWMLAGISELMYKNTKQK